MSNLYPKLEIENVSGSMFAVVGAGDEERDKKSINSGMILSKTIYTGTLASCEAFIAEKNAFCDSFRQGLEHAAKMLPEHAAKMQLGEMFSGWADQIWFKYEESDDLREKYIAKIRKTLK